MTDVSSIAVYCGSRVGTSQAYAEAARDLGRGMVARGVDLVFGGGRVGIMGEIADTVLEGGGKVTGVIPHFLDELEVGHEKVTELIRVDNMHIRKATMFNRADAFVILPGGLGTLEEFFEVVTWKQLQLHQKPIVVLNVAECWSRLTELTSDIVTAGFAHEKIANLFTMVETVDDIFQVISEAPTREHRSLEDRL
ncbi:MAG: TIGR00730 family Rossman fold protein [Rhodospirillales bacterium]|nr:TIGR00730 family Rossman fold protein [Rhodospirillales bacterium]